MEIIFLPEAQNDLGFWKKSGNLQVQKKISQLLKSIQESPFEGLGKPEPLKYQLAGKWSRRINKEHRLVYAVEEDVVFIYSMRGHYN